MSKIPELKKSPEEQKRDKDLKVLSMIIEDMENDVKEFEGKPFTGKTLGELHGNLCATVQAVARLLKEHIEATTPPKCDHVTPKIYAAAHNKSK